MEDLEKRGLKVSKDGADVKARDHAVPIDGGGGVVEVENDRDGEFLVSFDAHAREDPKIWSRTMKWSITAAMSAMCFNRILVSTVSSGVPISQAQSRLKTSVGAPLSSKRS